MDADKWDNNKWVKYGAASLIAWVFMSFVVGWVFLIPAAIVVFMVYGYVVYMRDRKHRIAVTIKPTEAMKALARREEEFKKETERILHEEFQIESKR